MSFPRTSRLARSIARAGTVTLLVFSMLSPLPAAADAATLYVTDRVLADLYPAPRAAGAPIQRIPTGTALRVLAHKGTFVRVRIADSSEGWIAVSQLQEEPPAQTLLLSLAAQQQRTVAELDRTRRQLAEYEQAELARQQNSHVWWTLLALLGALTAGFIAGIKWLDWRIRERHGGMRI